MSAFTTMPIAAPMRVSTIRCSEYSGDAAPSASTRIALIVTWFEVPGVIFRPQAMNIAAAMAASTTHACSPNASESPVATITPRITPIERSMALPKDWFTLGCTTSSAAIAAKIGSGPGMSQPVISQAAIVATAAFSTWSSGMRRDARNVSMKPMPSTLAAGLPSERRVGRFTLASDALAQHA